MSRTATTAPQIAPRTANDVLEALSGAFPDLPPALQAAARYIIDSPRQAGLQSLRAMALEASVHPNAFIRLARCIGFSGYEEMRERFRDFLISDDLGGFGERARWLGELAQTGGAAEVTGNMARTLQDNLERGFKRQEIAGLEQIAETVLKAERVFVLGVGAAYALAYQFWYVARMGFDHLVPLPRHGSHPLDDLATITKDDLLIAITFQPYRAETMAAARLAKAQGAGLIGITDSMTSPLVALSDDTLICPTHTPHFFPSQAAVTGLLETLVAILVSRGGAATAEKIARFHQRRLSAGIYEESAPLSGVG